MKNIWKGMAALLVGAALLTACGDDSSDKSEAKRS